MAPSLADAPRRIVQGAWTSGVKLACHSDHLHGVISVHEAGSHEDAADVNVIRYVAALHHSYGHTEVAFQELDCQIGDPSGGPCWGRSLLD